MNTHAIASIVVVGATLVFSPMGIAGPGGTCHFHGSKPATEIIVVDCAMQRKAALVSTGKLDRSWEAAKVDKAEQTDGKNGKEWRVTFKDPAAKDKSKETLFVFFTLSGNFIAANFTGQ